MKNNETIKYFNDLKAAKIIPNETPESVLINDEQGNMIKPNHFRLIRDQIIACPVRIGDTLAGNGQHGQIIEIYYLSSCNSIQVCITGQVMEISLENLINGIVKGQVQVIKN